MFTLLRHKANPTNQNAPTIYGGVFMQPLNKIRIQYQTTCQMLDLSRDGLRKLMKKDPTFPRPMKDGTSKQAPVYFDYQELIQWHEAAKQRQYAQSFVGAN